MKTTQPHFEEGHLNTHRRDHDSVITGYGKHDRVIAFQPDCEGLYVRVDHKWNLGEPSHQQILDVARKDQDIKGKWIFNRAEKWDCGKSTDYYFTK